MSDVVDIRPDVSAGRVIDPEYIQRRIEQLTRECGTVDIPVIVCLLNGDQPLIFANPLAYDHPLIMSGLLDVAKDSLRGIDGMIMEERDEDEEPA